jgi:uncharacterized membrane protein (DUF485 family)
MFLSSHILLAVDTTQIVTWISVVAVALLFAVIALICFKGAKKYDAKHIAFAGLTVGLSFALSFLKFSFVTTAVRLRWRLWCPF